MNHRNCKVIYSGPHNLYRIERNPYIEPEEKFIKRHAVPSIIEPQETLDIRRNISMIPKSVPQDWRVYGNISACAYLKPKERVNYLLKSGLGHYQIIDQYNTDEMFVVLSEVPNKEVIVCFRGTSLNSSIRTTRDDISNDILIGLSVDTFLSKRYKRSLKHSQQILSQYKDYPIIFTGHSLGATICNNVSRELNCASYSFALPSSLYQLSGPSKLGAEIYELFEKKSFNDKFIFCVFGDLIGEMSMNSSIQGIKKYVPAKSYNLHSIVNFC